MAADKPGIVLVQEVGTKLFKSLPDPLLPQQALFPIILDQEQLF